MPEPGSARHPVAGWLGERHSLLAEATVVLGLYGLYETSRGLVAGDPRTAIDHADEIASLERSVHVFQEAHVQAAAHAVPGLIGTLGFLYLTLHLTVTGSYLLWLHRRRPAAFPLVRTALLIASGLAVIGYVAFPTAPPRLAGLGIADTISGGHVDLNHGLVSSLYNPFAAVPSMHIGYAVVVGASLAAAARRRLSGAPAARDRRDRQPLLLRRRGRRDDRCGLALGGRGCVESRARPTRRNRTPAAGARVRLATPRKA